LALAYIKATRTLLREIPKRTSSDIPYAQIVFVALPLIRSNLRTALACLEQILDRADPRSVESMVAEIVKGAKPHGYYSAGLISNYVLDRAMQTRILSADEKALVLKLIEYARNLSPESVTASVIGELEKGLDCIETACSRCNLGGSTTQRSAKPVTSRPALVTAQVFPPPDPVGKRLVRLKLENILRGSLEREIDGTLGAILVFRHPSNTNPERIAVKTVLPERVNKKRAASPRAVVRLSHEVHQWIKYRHSPLILSPFFTELVCGWPYIVMPYCDCTLRDYIDGKVPRRGPAEAIALMVQCIAALEFAGQHGLSAHQDLKPENILLLNLPRRFGLPDDYPFCWQAKLADFGLADAYRELKIRWGSRPYMAPEQYEPEADLSKVDIFACGVILHELLTGRHPVGKVTSEVWPKPKAAHRSNKWTHEKVWKHWARKDEKFNGAAADESGGLRDAVAKALRTDPKARPSLAELRRELLDELKQVDSTAYANLTVLLEYFHFMSLNSGALDVDAERYQLEWMEKLCAAADLPRG
jgi:serine/threonine protein kinase